MKIKNLLVVAFAGLFALAACKKEPAFTPADDLTIKLNASMYGFTKATDTAFEEGDQIGVNVFKGEETWVENSLYTYNGAGLTAETPDAWYDEEEVEATITAYYPYAADFAGEFTVNTDQTTAENYAASDLLVATAKSYPTENAVNLTFKHALSKIVVNVDNQLKEEIENVMFTDVYSQVTFNPATPEDLEVAGSKGTVEAYKSGENTWQLIVVPQVAQPKLTLTTTSGEKYTFVLEEEVTFPAGKVRTANVTVSEESIYTSFTSNIENWVVDEELDFNLGTEEVLPEEEPTPDPVDPTPEEPETPVDPVDPTPEEPTTKEVRIYLNNSWGWTCLWCWDASGTQIFEGAAWPGTVNHGEDNGYYYWVVPEKYVGTTVDLLFAKDDSSEQSPDYKGVELSKDLYFYLEWTEETGVQLILEDK